MEWKVEWNTKLNLHGTTQGVSISAEQHIYIQLAIRETATRGPVLLQGYRNDGCLQQRQRNFSPGDSFGFRILMLRAILTQHFINPHLICTQPLAHSLPVPVTTALARSISSLKWWLIQLDSSTPVSRIEATPWSCMLARPFQFITFSFSAALNRILEIRLDCDSDHHRQQQSGHWIDRAGRIPRETLLLCGWRMPNGSEFWWSETCQACTFASELSKT